MVSVAFQALSFVSFGSPSQFFAMERMRGFYLDTSKRAVNCDIAAKAKKVSSKLGREHREPCPGSGSESGSEQ